MSTKNNIILAAALGAAALSAPTMANGSPTPIAPEFSAQKVLHLDSTHLEVPMQDAQGKKKMQIAGISYNIELSQDGETKMRAILNCISEGNKIKQTISITDENNKTATEELSSYGLNNSNTTLNGQMLACSTDAAEQAKIAATTILNAAGGNKTTQKIAINKINDIRADMKEQRLTQISLGNEELIRINSHQKIDFSAIDEARQMENLNNNSQKNNPKPK